MEPAELWSLDPTIDFLNHGSFGACPREVLDVQRELRDRMEAEPVRFLGRELEGRLDEARAALGSFVGAAADDLAFVPNATAGTATVLRSLRFQPGDELLTTDHEYNAALNAIRYAAEREGARVVVARIPFPGTDPDAIEASVLAAAGDRTRLAVISHVTSPTALVFPIERIVAALAERGIDTLVDGAHAPGMVPLALDALGAAYYTGNAHKWLCAPKGAAFLHVRRDRQAMVRPLAISHGANDPRTDRSRFRLEADWTGTPDPTACLSVPAAIHFGEVLLLGGWAARMAANRALALIARDSVCAALRIDPPVPDELIGSMAAIPIPGAPHQPDRDPLQAYLFDAHRVEVPINGFPVPGATGPADRAADGPGAAARQRVIRISAASYNRPEQYDRLAAALIEGLDAERRAVRATLSAR